MRAVKEQEMGTGTGTGMAGLGRSLPVCPRLMALFPP